VKGRSLNPEARRRRLEELLQAARAARAARVEGSALGQVAPRSRERLDRLYGFQAHEKVRLIGLKKHLDLNGQTGVVLPLKGAIGEPKLPSGVEAVKVQLDSGREIVCRVTNVDRVVATR